MSLQDGQMIAYLAALVGEHSEGRYLDVRVVAPSRAGMRRLAFAASQLDAASQRIERLSRLRDVYVGVALRSNTRSGGKDAINEAHLVSVEIDHPNAATRIERFTYPPSMVVSSGTIGHLHAYWKLSTAIGVAELELANRRLAHHLGGDPASTDAARVLRPPGSRNHKHQPPAPVRLLSLAPGRTYQLDELTGGLPDPPGRRARRDGSESRRDRRKIDEQLLAIPADEYVTALAGRAPDRAGKVRCPFHPLSVGRAVAAGVSPACSFADAPLTDRGGPR